MFLSCSLDRLSHLLWTVEFSLTRGICGRGLIRIRLGYHEESGYKNLVVYVCINAVLVELSLTRGICGRGLIKTRLGYHEKLRSNSPGDNIGTHEHC